LPFAAAGEAQISLLLGLGLFTLNLEGPSPLRQLAQPHSEEAFVSVSSYSASVFLNPNRWVVTIQKNHHQKESTTQKIGLQPAVAMLMRPKRKWNRREIIHHWHCMPILRKINRPNEKLASVANLYTNMRKLLRHINRKLLFFFFAARRTQDSPKLPLISAKRTDQAPLPAVPFDPQHSEQRPPTAQRANPRRRQHRRHRRTRRNESSIRLQKRPWEKLRKGPNLLIEAPSNFPIRR